MRLFEKVINKNTVNVLKIYNTYLILLLCLAACILISPDFFTVTNAINIGRQYAGVTIVSLGMLIVILTGGIDLSVGMIVALGSVTLAICLTHGLGIFLSVVLTIAVGLLCGTISGFFVAKMKMPSFVVTLAMMTMANGAAFMASNGSPIRTPQNTIVRLGDGTVGGIPLLVILAACFVLTCFFIINYTSFGRLVLAIGSNEVAVRLSGIRVDRYKMAVYSISGMCAAVGGIVATSRTAIGTPLYGAGLELDAIAACVIGGASLSGGEGSAVKTLVGVLILALIGNIMNLLAVPSYPQAIIKGIIIIASTLIQVFTASNRKAV
ncbi:ABC transporter permease [Propionispora hippei]|uniref:Ribose transport system permease protein n=1 Tax=Propionispora hippei DSM 15287 TaxID=1123003 RepID=A0A1M6I0Y0_9FIRM|nr:ABC transporter permease [Propionispora hippei]SHJ28149.1 ribose transport system permease protein [Propionispora hippei DSM 15287]